MPVSLTPHYLFERYDQIEPGWLARQGITLLLSDLDFTLAPKSVRRPDGALRGWIAALKAEGIDFMIVSNNRSGRRVTEFCADLGVLYQGHARKPSPRGLEAAMARAGADRRHTAMLGDKLLTDMAAGQCLVLGECLFPEIHKQLRWRACHPKTDMQSTSQGGATGLVFYSVNNADAAVSLLKKSTGKAAA